MLIHTSYLRFMHMELLKVGVTTDLKIESQGAFGPSTHRETKTLNAWGS